MSCGGGGGDTPDPSPQPVENKAPSVPTLSKPDNNVLCIDNVVQFSWNAATDPDGDPVSYEFQIATDNQFSENLQNKTASSTSISIDLNKGVAYYWRVKAKDSKNASSNYSSSFSFYTEGEGQKNHVPFSPAIVSPALNEIVQEGTIKLEWNATDVDNDPLTYDVYFGTVNPPTNKVAEGQSENSYSLDITSFTNYYWSVVAKDNKGGVTIGQVWNFKTD